MREVGRGDQHGAREQACPDPQDADGAGDHHDHGHDQQEPGPRMGLPDSARAAVHSRAISSRRSVVAGVAGRVVAGTSSA